jgi:hypothetical protein
MTVNERITLTDPFDSKEPNDVEVREETQVKASDTFRPLKKLR